MDKYIEMELEHVRYVGHLSGVADVVVGRRVATAATGVSRYTGGRGLVTEILGEMG